MRRRPFYPYVRIHSRALHILIPLLILAAAIIFAALHADRQLSAVLEQYAQASAKDLISQVINRSILDEIAAADPYYQSIVSVQHDSADRVIAIQTDPLKINQLKSSVIRRISNQLQDATVSNIQIPVGTLTGKRLLLGKGPGISIRLVPVGAATATVSSQFETSGINQTIHRIVLQVDIGVTLIMPGFTGYCENQSQMVLAETVVVGEVPETYTYIEDSRTDVMEKYHDYGTVGN